MAQHHKMSPGNASQLSIANSRSFAVLLESISEGVLLVNEAGTILHANSNALTLFATHAEALIGRTVESLVPESVRAGHKKLRESFAESPSIRPMGRGLDLAAQRSDGSTFPAEISLSYLEDGEDRVFVAFISDITERKRQEAAMVQAGKFAAIGELAGNIAHEVNNPIGIISAKAHLILSNDGDGISEKTRTDLQKIIQQCERLSNLTRGLLDFSRPALGRKETIALHAPIRNALGLVGDRAQQRRVEVLERLFAENDSIVGNANELQQVFLNLFLNAFDAMVDGGRLTVETSTLADTIQIRVADTGPGMVPKIATQIFEPFFTTKETGGTGLGLSICHGLVRSHQGTLDVASKPGKGTIFTLSFPLHPTAP